MTNHSSRFLVIYSGVLTIALAVIVLTGASDGGKVVFEELDVQRINVREPDGTLRMVISNLARQPGLIVRGKEEPHSNPENRQFAGMLFFDDEGSEAGGLAFSGKRDEDGKVGYRMHLTMDQYDQNEALAIAHGGDDNNRWAGLRVFDQPDTPILEMLETVEQKKGELSEEEYKKWGRQYLEQNRLNVERVYVGKNDKRESLLRLSDAHDKPRLQLRVTADGEAAIEFLDDAGKVAHRLTPESLTRRE